MKYRKKPVEIEAVQLTEETIDEVMEFCGDKIKSHPLTGVVIETLEGNMLASKGDYIIKGVKGEFYPCKPDIFEMTYEKSVNMKHIKTQEQLNESSENLNMSDVMSSILNELEENRLKYNIKSRNVYNDTEYQGFIDGKLDAFEEAIKIVKTYYA